MGVQGSSLSAWSLSSQAGGGLPGAGCAVPSGRRTVPPSRPLPGDCLDKPAMGRKAGEFNLFPTLGSLIFMGKVGSSHPKASQDYRSEVFERRRNWDPPGQVLV